MFYLNVFNEYFHGKAIFHTVEGFLGQESHPSTQSEVAFQGKIGQLL